MGDRRSVIMLIGLLVILAFGNAQAAIEVESWPLPVDPDSPGARIGPFSLVFSGPDLAAPGNTDEFYYVLVRISMTEGVFIYKAEGCPVYEPPLPCHYDFYLAVEVVSGNPALPAVDAVEVLHVAPTYIDILFRRNMNFWNLNSQNRVRVSYGTLYQETPQGTANMLPGWQPGSKTCCCFSDSDTDFLPDGDWSVQLEAYYSNSEGEILGDFPAVFTPERPVLAVAGPPQRRCGITAEWPVDEGPPAVSPGLQSIPEIRLCPWGECAADGWITYCDDPITYADETTPQPPFGAGHLFVVSETCDNGGFLFESTDQIYLSIKDDLRALDPYFARDDSHFAWLTGGGLAEAVPLEVWYTNQLNELIVNIDPGFPLDPDRTEPLRVWIDLGTVFCNSVCGEAQAHLARYDLHLTVDIWYNAHYWFCEEVDDLILGFPVARLLQCLRGDLDEDGAITAVDILLLADYQAGMLELDDTQRVEVDRNNDCLIDATDLVLSLIPWHSW